MKSRNERVVAVRRGRAAASMAALALLLAGRVAADTAETSPPQAHFSLANGLDVLVEENHREPHVAVLVSYDAGKRDEPAGYSSLAHLVEHLTFRRSRHLKDYAGLELLERAGAESMNGETRADRTLYYAVVPSNALSLALWLESERMGFTLEAFDDAALDHERDVVRAEIDSRHNAYSRFFAHVETALFGEGHPYAAPADPAQDLDSLTLRDVQSYFQRGYRPDDAHLVMVGDVTLGAGRALAEHYFGSLVNPAAPRSSRPPLAPAKASGGRLTYLTSDYAWLLVEAYRAPAPGSRAHVAAELLVQALRLLLVPELVDHNHVAVFVNLELDDRTAGSELVLQAAPRQGVTFPVLESALRRALAAVTPQSLAGVLREARAGLVEHEWMLLADPLARARAHVEALAVSGRPYDSDARIQTLRALTEAELAPLLTNLTSPLLTAEVMQDRDADQTGTVVWSRP